MAETFREWLLKQSERTDRWPTKRAFARALGEPYDNVLRWLYRNVVPRHGMELKLAEVTDTPVDDVRAMLDEARHRYWIALQDRVARRREQRREDQSKSAFDRAPLETLERKDLHKAAAAGVAARLFRTPPRAVTV